MSARCSHHCSACCSHFTSLRAFDAHRSGPHDGERVCWDPDVELPLRIRSEDALCDITDETRTGVMLWEHGPSADRARAVFSLRAAA
jgi:hypothetical protein